MNIWLQNIMPISFWTYLHISVSVIAAFSLFYLLEQLVIYGGGHFSQFTVGLYRVSLSIIIIGLFIGFINGLIAGRLSNPTDTISVVGLAALSLVIAITHRHHNHFNK